MSGWIQLHRKLLDNPIFKNHKLLQTFLYCLLRASHKEHDILIGEAIVRLKKGQLATGRKAISAATGLTEQNIRTSLSKLETLSILTINPTTKYSIISISNWESYQQTNQQVTNNQPTSNQQVTTNNNVNKGKNVNKKAVEVKFPDWLNKESWADFEQHRIDIKKPMSKLARTKAINSMEDLTFEQQQRCIDQSIQSRWAGLFPDKYKTTVNQPVPPSPQKPMSSFPTMED